MSPHLLEAEVLSQGLVFRNAPATWVVILVILPAIVAFVAIFYRMGREGTPKVRALLAILRVLALVLVALLLMDPAIETLVVERKPTLTVVLADASASMSHRDDYSTSEALADSIRAGAKIPEGTPLDAFSRMDLLKKTLDDPADPFLEQLGQKHKLRVYSFGEKLQAVAGVRDLEANDRVTGLGRALERILEEPEVKSSPVGGIVVLSDGKNNVEPEPSAVVELAKKRKIPVHTVGVGDPQALKDVELVSVLAPAVALVEDRIAIDMKVRHRGFPGQRIEVRLLENGQPLERQAETLLPSEEDQDLRMFYRPERTGQLQWVVEIRPLPGEHTTDNNRRTIDINVKSDKLKVLYIESYPRWEYRTLKDFLIRSPESFQAQCFLIDADRGFAQESTPPLDSLSHLPDTEEALFWYDVILFGDVDPDKLGDDDPERSRKFMQMVKKFVEEGGGFAMIAGERFSPRAYKDTPIGEILPVIVDPTEVGPTGDGSDQGFKMRLTEAGRQHPIMQLAEDPERNQPIWEGRDDPLALKDMWWFFRVKKAKPGALVLATHGAQRNAHGPYVLLASGNYGAGPVLFMAADETWRWYWWQGPYLHHRYWGNVVRHLARTRLYAGDKRFRLFANRSEYQRGDRVTVTAWVKDRTFRPADFEEQEILLRQPDGTEKRQALPRIEPGKFERTFVATDTGDWHAWIPPEDGLTDEKISPVTFRVVDADVERKEPILDEPALRALAEQTGGKYVTLPEARALLSTVAQGMVEVPRQRRTLSLRSDGSGYLQYLPWALLLLLTTEWIIRKRYRFL